MPASAAIAAYGTVFQMDDGSLNFTNIAELRDISGPDLKLDVKEVTTHASPGAYKERISTLIDGGTVTFTINYITTGATHNNSAGLIYVLNNRLLRSFKVIFPSTTTWQFKGYVTSFKPDMKVDSELSAAVTVTIAGQPTLV